eukprot:m.55856 g.55856  ORF g.55856 m.55856 type:complete len:304 (-) comp13664_c0_seq7:290-1201(-)
MLQCLVVSLLLRTTTPFKHDYQMTSKAPVVFLSHGGGPCWFLDNSAFAGANRGSSAAKSLQQLHATAVEAKGGMSGKPRAIVVVSAHWEVASGVQVSTSLQPSLLYDYYGFPPETYAPHLTYPCPGEPDLAATILDKLTEHGIRAEGNAERGLDHGVFVPLKLMYPDADIPVVQVSLNVQLDPLFHYKLGQALAFLRHDNVLLIASGQATHNMGARGVDTPGWATDFVQWLDALATESRSQTETAELIENWKSAPGATMAHPREEHLVPLFVALGAVGSTGQGERVLDGWMAKSFSLASYMWS